jgi:hypothetical protein
MRSTAPAFAVSPGAAVPRGIASRVMGFVIAVWRQHGAKWRRAQCRRCARFSVGGFFGSRE